MDEKNRDLLEQFMQMHGLLVRRFHRRHMANGPMGTPYSGQGRVLKFLKLKPEFTQKELAELMGLRSQSLGELLAKLEKNGYVTRAPSETDRRVITVRLTEKGVGASEEDLQDEANLFDCLSEEEQTQLSDYLRRLIHTMEEQSMDPLNRGRRRELRGHRRGFGDPHF